MEGSTQEEDVLLGSLVDEKLLVEMKTSVEKFLLEKASQCNEVLDERSVCALAEECLASSALSQVLEDSVYERMHAPAMYHITRAGQETVPEFLSVARQQWQLSVLSQLQTLLKRAHARRFGGSRSAHDADETVARARGRWKSPSAAKHLEELRCKGYKSVISRQQLIDFCCSISDPVYTPYAGFVEPDFKPGWCLIHRLAMSVASYSDMQSLLSPLLDGKSGLLVPFTLDDVIGRNTLLDDTRLKLAEKTLALNRASACRQVCKLTCPMAKRGDIWYRLLVCDRSKMTVAQSKDDDVQKLISKYHRLEVLIDGVAQRNVHETAANDENYFVFEDMMHRTMLLFLRDSWIRVHSFIPEVENLSPADILSVDADQEEDPRSSQILSTTEPSKAPAGKQVFPPCGVVPAQDFSFFIAPMCFVYPKLADLYNVFRVFFVSYFCYLTSLTSTHRCSLLSLLYLFETLVQERSPCLFEHLVVIDAQPAKIVVPWLSTAFASALSPEQVLSVWDFIVGYDSTEVLAVIAAALFSFRQASLLSASSSVQVEEIMADVRSVSVVLAIEQFLLEADDAGMPAK